RTRAVTHRPALLPVELPLRYNPSELSHTFRSDHVNPMEEPTQPRLFDTLLLNLRVSFGGQQDREIRAPKRLQNTRSSVEESGRSLEHRLPDHTDARHLSRVYSYRVLIT